MSRTVHFGGGAAAVTLSVHDLSGQRLAEHDDAGAVLREYVWLDGRPLAVVEGGQTYWLSWDQIGRPVMATDAAGAVVWAASYLPFGGIREVLVDTGALVQALRFPGQWFQAETGLHQNWHRDYDPTTGRYLQADPLGLVDGASVYGYARQSPIVYIDPNGLSLADLYRGARSYVRGIYYSGRYGCRISGVCGAEEQQAAIREGQALLDLVSTLFNNHEARKCFAFLLDFYLDRQPEQTAARIATGMGVTAVLGHYGGSVGYGAGAGLGAAAIFGDIMRGIEIGQGVGAFVRGIVGDLSLPPNSIPFMPCGCEELLKDVTGLG